jgi:hypothetical protein
VKLKLGVKGVVIPLELEVPHRILVAGAQVGVILTDANHCPGAVCLLFELPGGKVSDAHARDKCFCGGTLVSLCDMISVCAPVL